MGVFVRLFQGFAPQEPSPARSVITATQRKTLSTATSRAHSGDVCRWIGRTTRGVHATLHGGCDDSGRPIRMLLTQDHVSDDDGARQRLSQ